MRRYLIVLLCSCVLILNSCNDPESHPIDPERMVNILVDIHIMEASLLGYTEEQKDTLTQLYYGQIYEIHSVSEEKFYAEMEYLKRNPDDFKDLYDKVLEEIDRREAEQK